MAAKKKSKQPPICENCGQEASEDCPTDCERKLTWEEQEAIRIGEERVKRRMNRHKKRVALSEATEVVIDVLDDAKAEHKIERATLLKAVIEECLTDYKLTLKRDDRGRGQDMRAMGPMFMPPWFY